jgi:mRNA interferase RelE/StbE
MAYRIEWKRSALKELRQLPQSIIIRVMAAVESLADNPYPAGIRKLAAAEYTYRLRVGDYRVVYTVDDDILVVEIVRVRHRKDAYRDR